MPHVFYVFMYLCVQLQLDTKAFPLCTYVRDILTPFSLITNGAYKQILCRERCDGNSSGELGRPVDMTDNQHICWNCALPHNASLNRWPLVTSVKRSRLSSLMKKKEI